MNIIQPQNNAFRQGMFVNLDNPSKAMSTGKYVVTQGVNNLKPDDKARELVAVRNYKDFNEDNDIYDAHDFGVVELPNIPKLFWKIDYFQRVVTLTACLSDASTSHRSQRC